MSSEGRDGSGGGPGGSGLAPAADFRRDVEAIARIEAVPVLLRVLCETTGMGFAAVARVTAGHWTACAVQDDIGFGLLPGGQLDVHTTLCKEVREARAPVVIDQASLDPVYASHHTPRIYGIESYVSVPIVLEGGEYFGNLCAIDPRPRTVSEPRTVAMFTLFAQLVALELQHERNRGAILAALASAEATAELREQFIAVLGHDLRNPLSAVAACSQLIGRKAGDAEQVRDLATRIDTNVRRMSHLIDDITDFARGRLASGLDIGSQRVDDLGDSLMQVVAELRDSHPDRVIRADVRIGRPVWCDRGRLQQLASNLLANALTHGAPDREVEFTATAGDGRLVIDVWNAGEPIPEASLGKIFAPFWRRSISTQREGLGLGLHICDQIARAHGGRVEVSSTADAGTRFTATLPLEPA